MDSCLRLLWCEARLTNHAELVGALGLDPTAGDSDVVAAAVGRWGEAAPHRMMGAFAYAADGPRGPTVTRDALGIMPAYWARDATGQIHFSDSLSTLAAVDGVDHSTDERLVAANLIRVPGLCGDRTEMVGVRRVPPGTTVHTGGVEPGVVRWWDPDHVAVRRRLGVEDAAAELRQLLVVAVGDHLAMVRRRHGDAGLDGVAAHVSGGLDSTVVAFLAADVLGATGHALRAAISWSPERSPDDLSATGVQEHGFDERDRVEDLARQLRTEAWFGPNGLGEAPWVAALDSKDYPRATIERESWLAEAAGAAGVTHVLSGWGGDEFASFNGRGTNRAIVRSARLGALRSAYRDRRRRGLSAPRAVAATLRPGLPYWCVRGGRGAGKPTKRQQARLALVAETFPELCDAYHRHHHELRRAVRPRAVQLALYRHDHLAHRIEAWHQMGLRFGFDYGYPLLDRRIVEWALSVPPETFRDGNHSRRVFRMAITGIVPEEICTTEKHDPVLNAAVAAALASADGI